MDVDCEKQQDLTCADPEVHLKVDGEVVAPLGRDGHTYSFRFLAGSKDVQLCSLANRPSNANDPRWLGVAVHRISLTTPTRVVVINHDDPLLSQGFHFAEPFHRWTLGEASIPGEFLESLGDGFVIATVELAGVLPSYSRDVFMPKPPRARTRKPSAPIVADPPLQRLGADVDDHYEGVAFSSSGHLLAVAAAWAKELHVFKRSPAGAYEEAPALRLRGVREGMVFPHDVAFATIAGAEILVGLERRGVVTIWSVGKGEKPIGDKPVGRVNLQPVTGGHTDTIAFAPNEEGRFAVANYRSSMIFFFKLEKTPRGEIVARHETTLMSPHLMTPDGIAFSDCGRWLAAANHGNDTVVVFRRLYAPGRGPVFDPRPVCVIRDPVLRHPHSLGFAPQSTHLLVTSAGCGDVHVFDGLAEADDMTWSGRHSQALAFCPPEIFERVNKAERGEGGAKGLDLRGDRLGVVSPEVGVKIFRLNRME